MEMRLWRLLTAAHICMMLVGLQIGSHAKWLALSVKDRFACHWYKNRGQALIAIILLNARQDTAHGLLCTGP
jgi:hypothetical protein